ncbi:UDP-N-acetyl glucosamine 2-epimerase [Beggiatoa alba]|nr:UDP-N-acetyl glucosamine 2-epimerase [Beggiatoa alba]
MGKFKIVTVVGTRPEIIRLSRIINKFEQLFDHVLVHTGQNFDYELSDVFFKDMNISAPKYYLESDGTPMEIVGNILSRMDGVLDNEKPDGFVVLGDTFSCLSSLAAKMKKIPVFHLEAGSRCFDDRVPEEILRKIVDSIADINIVYSDIERLNLLNEGYKQDFILKSGSPMTEVLNYYNQAINDSQILEKLNLYESDYFLFSSHRAEHMLNEKKFNKIVNILTNLAKKYSKRVVVTCHPGMRKQLSLLVNNEFSKLIEFHKPFAFTDYNKLQLGAICTISDSGTISEESAIMGFNAINIRGSQERPSAMDEGNIILSNVEWKVVSRAIDFIMSKDLNASQTIVPNDYSRANVSDIVARQVMSGIQYVNRKVWLSEKDL